MNALKLYRIKPRQNLEGMTVRDSFKDVDDTVSLYPAWIMDEDDPYPGEWAMYHPTNYLYNTYGVMWIASGDLEEVK